MSLNHPMTNKKELNEFSLITVLGGIALFAWFTMFFDKLADRVDAYYHGRSVEVQRALKKIIKNLSKQKSFLARIDDDVEKYGIGSGLISAIMKYPETKNELNQYKNDKEVNYNELITELTKILTESLYEEAEERGMIDKIEKQVKNTKWNN